MPSVLVVEDSESDQFLTKIALQRYDADLEVLQAYDGQEALDMLSGLEEKPVVIFLDINMPGMNGYEFLDEYSNVSEGQRSKVVMLTSSSFDGDLKKSMAYPIVKDYFQKPLTAEMIQRAMEN